MSVVVGNEGINVPGSVAVGGGGGISVPGSSGGGGGGGGYVPTYHILGF